MGEAILTVTPTGNSLSIVTTDSIFTKVTSWEPLIGSGSEASANMVIIHYQEHEDASLVSLNDLQILSIFFLGKGEN
jgi:hypothetical protein